MGILSKVWFDGVLSGSLTPILTVSGESAVAPVVELSSESESTVAAEIYYNCSGTDRRIAPFSIPAGGSARVRLANLPDGDIVKGLVSEAAVITCVVSGGSQT